MSRVRWPAARTLLAALLLAWVCAVWVLNRPGHLSVDSLIQIAEGRSGVFNSYNPVFISVVFGKLTAMTGGTDVLVLMAVVSLAASVWLLLERIEGPGVGGTVAACVLLFLPVPLIYPGIVWKDVAFAHAALLAFALATRRGKWPPLVVEGLCLALFACAMLSRQTGILVAGVGVLMLAGSAPDSRRSWPRALVAFATRLAVLLVLAQGLSLMARSAVREVNTGSVATGVRLVAIFDIAGMLQRLPQERLDRLAHGDVDTAAFEDGARRTFSAERVDTLEILSLPGIWAVPIAEMLGQWRDLVVASPAVYLAHRAEVYAWLLGLREQRRCLPVHLGYESGPLADRAGIDAPQSPYASRLFRYARAFVGSPYFAPAAWAGVSIFVLIYLRRRGLRRTPIGALQWAGLVYLASYFPVAMSCDFRYTYFTTLAANVGLMFALIDWTGRRRDRARQRV